MRFVLHVFFFGCLLISDLAQAAIITVTTTADTIANNGECSLREAIINANNNDQSGSTDCAAGDNTFPVPLNIIRFDPGLAGATIALNGTPLPVVTKTLIMEGPLANDPAGVVLNGAQSSRILELEGASPGEFTVVLRNLTLSGGRTVADGVAASGGAARAVNANLVLEHVSVSGNSTLGNDAVGGGIHVADGNLHLTRSSVVNNSTAGFGAFGGGAAVIGGELVDLDGTLIGQNMTTGIGRFGGGLYFESTSARLTNSIVSANSTAGSAARGGGIAGLGSDALLIGTTVVGNSTSGGTFMDAVAHGGGMAINAGNSVLLINTTVTGNSVLGTDASGGGLRVRGGVLTLVHSTVAFNTAADGTDGIFYLGNPTFPPDPPHNEFHLVNSLVVQDGAGETACSQTAAGFENTLATDPGCTGTGIGAPFIGLQPLADHGGPTPTHAIGPSSVALDAAGDCQNLFTFLLLPPTDQRGLPRPFGPACDIGAFEYTPELVFEDRFEAQ